MSGFAASPKNIELKLLDIVLSVSGSAAPLKNIELCWTLLSMHLDVDDVTYDEVRCYLLVEVQLSRGTSKISIIGPDCVSSLDIIHPFCEVIPIPLSHCECIAILRPVMLVGVSTNSI